MSKYSSFEKDRLIFENWRKFNLKEQEEAQPSGMSMDTQTSFKIFAKKPKLAARFMQELLKGGDLFKQFQAAQEGRWYTTKSVDDLKNWLDGIGGIEVFAKRAAVIGAKIPDSGIPKKDMPFLPGPDDAQGDVKDVADALGPGGDFNVDLVEKTAPPPSNTFVGMKDPKAQAFMTGGLNDGVPEDDNIKIELGGGIVAAEAIPTQSNILINKGLGMAIKGMAGGDLDAYGGLNGEILDGHHRWSATMLNDPSATINTIARIDLDTLGRDETLKYLTAIGNALGNKTKVKQ